MLGLLGRLPEQQQSDEMAELVRLLTTPDQWSVGPDDIFRRAIVSSYREQGGHAQVERPRWATEGHYAAIAEPVLHLGEARLTIGRNLGVQVVGEARLGPERVFL